MVQVFKTFFNISGPVDGGWGMWKPWSDCSKTCGGGGEAEKTRECDSPAPAHGGKECKGDDTMKKECGGLPCKYKVPGT